MTDDEKKVYNAMKKAKDPVRPGEIATATGIDSKEVGKIINSLKKEGKVVSPKRCFYTVA